MKQHLTRRRAVQLVLCTWAGAALSGCGQTGPLYFPPEEEKETEAEGKEVGEEKTEDGEEKKTSQHRLDSPWHQARRAGRSVRTAL